MYMYVNFLNVWLVVVLLVKIVFIFWFSTLWNRVKLYTSAFINNMYYLGTFPRSKVGTFTSFYCHPAGKNATIKT